MSYMSQDECPISMTLLVFEVILLEFLISFLFWLVYKTVAGHRLTRLINSRILKEVHCTHIIGACIKKIF